MNIKKKVSCTSDFREEGGPTPQAGANIPFSKKFARNGMKEIFI